MKKRHAVSVRPTEKYSVSKVWGCDMVVVVGWFVHIREVTKMIALSHGLRLFLGVLQRFYKGFDHIV